MIKDPLAGYFAEGGQVGFRRRTPIGEEELTDTTTNLGGNVGDNQAAQEVPPGTDLGAPPQNPVPAPDNGGGSDGPDNSVDVFSDEFQNAGPAAGSLTRGLESLGFAPTTATKIADWIDPMDKVATTPGITGGYGGISGSDNYGMVGMEGGQGISTGMQDLGWNAITYGNAFGGMLPGGTAARLAGEAIIDNQIDKIDASFDALDDDLTGYDAKSADDMITISDAMGNVRSMTKGEYEAMQGEPGSAQYAAEINAGQHTTTQDVGGQTVSFTPNANTGVNSAYIDANGDGVQQSNERSVVTSSDGTPVTSSSGAPVTSRSADEIAGYTGNTGTVGLDVADSMTWDDVVNNADWAVDDTGTTGGTGVESLSEDQVSSFEDQGFDMSSWDDAASWG